MDERTPDQGQEIAPGMRVRPQRAGDEDFLLALCEAVEAERFVGAGPALAGPLTAAQARMRALGYAASFPQGESLIVEADGRPAGRLYLAREADGGLRVVDVIVAAAARGRGAGAALLAWVERTGRALGAPALRLTVQADNPARRLYARAGFREAADEDEDGPARVHLPMEKRL